MYLPRIDSVEDTRYYSGMTNRTENMIIEIQHSELPLRADRFDISDHATARFIQRVAPKIPDSSAVEIFQCLVNQGRTRATPRWWMKHKITMTPGMRFLYWAHLPDVCAIVRNGTVVTVMTKSMFKSKRSVSMEIEQSNTGKRNHKRISRPVFKLVEGDVA